MINKASSLPAFILAIIKGKNTELPFSGEYNDFSGSGTYLCRLCGLALFRSDTKFHSGCGWPSFDQEIEEAVIRVEEPATHRIEILCARCQAHLGHVFTGEHFTQKNLRHCVNSLSLDFVSDKNVIDTEEAIFAGGCFWGMEFYFRKLNGVLKTEVGYMGGHRENPSYSEVCSGTTDHLEVLRVVYDPSKIQYEDLAKYFFEIHDPTDPNGQGPDRGTQYLSVAFYYDDNQKKTIETLVQQLKLKGYPIVTGIKPVSTFWPAEPYHQTYYEKTGKMPYCHRYEKKF
jgi:peptide methionine sulfoxide reductase msrA/msrB